MSEAKIVCVYNNKEIFDKVIQTNENLKDCKIFGYDNTSENTAITKRYNDFIKKNVTPLSDFWVVFIHQDFGFMQDVNKLLEKLNKKHIYGAIGVTLHRGLFWGKTEIIEGRQKWGFKDSIALTWGRILQGNNDFNFKKHGRPVFFPFTVDSTDCCCMMMHSSLINKYTLRFDENLNFHMYAEELCYRVKHEHKIKTKVVQIKCYHLGKGNIDEDFQKSADYLKEKFKIKRIPSTCKN